jgi:NADPH:quinone reductase
MGQGWSLRSVSATDTAVLSHPRRTHTEEIAVKAFALTGPDSPASLVELPEPEITPDTVRVRVKAVSVNGFDAVQASGSLVSMMEHVFPTVIGRDFAGVVEAVGANRTDVAVGDAVLGFIPSTPPLHDGTYAEIVTGSSGIVLAPKPPELPFEAAAAIPLAGATARDAFDAVDPRKGDTVLVVGATGGVGSIAVQLAAHREAIVIATARPGPEEVFVRALGATEIVDHSRGDVAEAIRARWPEGVTSLIDLVNRDEAFASMAALVRDGGRVATTLGAADVDALARRNVQATNVMGNPTPEKLALLADQAGSGAIRIEIQQMFPLAEAAAALAAFSAGTVGKIVLIVEEAETE